ncbi:MAG: L,D-transpeptidase family protein [Sphingomonas sp.]|nr:L,D-transpeptidase family protein [Sphingomonas sp.]
MRAFFLALLIAVVATPLQAAPWARPAASALLDYGQRIETHGLDPADYELGRLRMALAGQDQAALDAAATRSFALLARDLANGHTPVAQRRLSYFRGMGLTPEAAATLMDRALIAGDITGALDRLAPTSADYRMLRAALVSQPASGAEAEKARIRANLERWRWLPRDLGGRYLMVNIPEYVVRLVDNGQVIATHRVVVGKRKTPTPQFQTSASGIILNPTWTVPQSIIAESVGALVRNRPGVARARGYSWSGSGGNLQVVQQPGPTNALGQMKIDMPNPLSIFLHDTPSKTLFGQPERAFSHGCVRTDKPFDLAAKLLAGTEWTPERIAQVIEGRETVTAKLPRPVPVYVVYMTVQAEPGGALRSFEDLYGLDAGLSQSLGATGLAATRPLADTYCAAG